MCVCVCVCVCVCDREMFVSDVKEMEDRKTEGRKRYMDTNGYMEINGDIDINWRAKKLEREREREGVGGGGQLA